MESIIIQGIRHLHVLPSYYNKMDEFAKDLNSALEESSDRRSFEKVKRNKPWKFRQKPKTGITFGSPLGKSSIKSEDSESSLDHWIQHQMDFSTNGSYHHTDSDSILCRVSKNNNDLLSWRQCQSIVAESDSVNENLPMREPRRKRKFKRMSVDPPCGEDVFSSISTSTLFSQKNKRQRNLKPQKTSKLSIKSPKLSKSRSVTQLPSKMDSIDKDGDNFVAASGKRKRCSHERNLECTGCDCKELFYRKSATYFHKLRNRSDQSEFGNSNSIEVNTSSVSSSESECGILTNDEGREGDDEHSDYFHEPELSTEIQNFSPWCDDDLIVDEEQMSDEKMQKAFSVNFLDGLENVKSAYTANVDRLKCERQIKSGRRRLGKSVSGCTIGPDSIYSSLNEYSNMSSMDACLNRTTPNEKKKRKGMPSSHGFSETLAAVSESNTGYRVLKNMTWKPIAPMSRSTDGVSPFASNCRLGSLKKIEERTIHSATNARAAESSNLLPSKSRNPV